MQACNWKHFSWSAYWKPVATKAPDDQLTTETTLQESTTSEPEETASSSSEPITPED
jgi:hypothetical protein